MIIYNQFRLLMPKKKVSKAKLLDIIDEHTEIIEKSDNKIKLSFKAGRIEPSVEWDLVITLQENDFEILIENDLIPKTLHHYTSIFFSGRKLLELIESSIKKYDE